MFADCSSCLDTLHWFRFLCFIRCAATISPIALARYYNLDCFNLVAYIADTKPIRQRHLRYLARAAYGHSTFLHSLYLYKACDTISIHNLDCAKRAIHTDDTKPIRHMHSRASSANALARLSLRIRVSACAAILPLFRRKCRSCHTSGEMSNDLQ